MKRLELSVRTEKPLKYLDVTYVYDNDNTAGITSVAMDWLSISLSVINMRLHCCANIHVYTYSYVT